MSEPRASFPSDFSKRLFTAKGDLIESFLYSEFLGGWIVLSFSRIGLRELRLCMETEPGFSSHSRDDGEFADALLRVEASGASFHARVEDVLELLGRYFQGDEVDFRAVGLDLSGYTDFERRVYRELRDIPYGHTLSYSEVAQRIGASRAARAVGAACGKNRIPIVIPCHRVVGKNGLGGYGLGLSLKQKLLDLERRGSSPA